MISDSVAVYHEAGAVIVDAASGERRALAARFDTLGYSDAEANAIFAALEEFASWTLGMPAKIGKLSICFHREALCRVKEVDAYKRAVAEYDAELKRVKKSNSERKQAFAAAEAARVPIEARLAQISMRAVNIEQTKKLVPLTVDKEVRRELQAKIAEYEAEISEAVRFHLEADKNPAPIEPPVLEELPTPPVQPVRVPLLLVDAIADPSVDHGVRVIDGMVDEIGYAALIDAMEELSSRVLEKV